MADLLSHVLVAYVILTVLGWYADAITYRWVVVGMGGAAIPDLVKVSLVVSPQTVEGALGIPVSYGPLSTVGGVCLVAGVLALAFAGEYRRRAYGFLVAGGGLSLVGDGLRTFADGASTAWLYPLTWWRPPTPGLYVSSDYRVLLVALAVAGAVALVDSYRRPGSDAETASER